MEYSCVCATTSPLPSPFFSSDCSLDSCAAFSVAIASSSRIENAGNKFRTSFLMEVHKIPHPKTIVAEDVNKALIAADKFEDVVLKPLFGNQGKGLVRVKGRSTVAKLKALNLITQ